MHSIRRWPVRYLWLAAMAGVAASLNLASTTAAASYPVSSMAAASHLASPTITQIANPVSQPQMITAGPDGAMWFTNQGTNSIGRITTTGQITTFTGTGISRPDGITAGPDGNLWFTNYGNNSITRMTPG